MAVQIKSAATASTAAKPTIVETEIGILSPSVKMKGSIALIFSTAYPKIKNIANGKAITSRDNQEVRHIAAARQARSGCPRWKKDATKPAISSNKLSPAAYPLLST